MYFNPMTYINKKMVGERIKKIRNGLGLTMRKFGELIDNKASGGNIANWEKGLSLPNKERLDRISEIGNVSVDWLLHGDYKLGAPDPIPEDYSEQQLPQMIKSFNWLPYEEKTELRNIFLALLELMKNKDKLLKEIPEEYEASIQLGNGRSAPFTIYRSDIETDEEGPLGLIKPTALKKLIEENKIYFDGKTKKIVQSEIDSINSKVDKLKDLLEELKLPNL